ncbi:MAG: type I restriction enzyme HsdR N-terminal domain-containing protein [Bacteroidales bacterium]|nr:type I restriction enzyme HsdR N-terminal domain-containing protein [Bacteroidales bacterium]
MHPLNLPSFEVRLRESDGKTTEVFDPLRKKFVKLTPEEWVRQHMLNYMTAYLNFPPSLIGVEVRLKYNGMRKRSDIVAYDRNGEPLLVVECKAPSVTLTQDVIYQIAMYNSALMGKYLVVSNGLVHYSCRLDPGDAQWIYLAEIPDFARICS